MNNSLSNVRVQFQTRGYAVDEIRRDSRDLWWEFSIVSTPDGQPVGVSVAFIQDGVDSPAWNPADIRWGTDVKTHQGSDERSPADMADTIIASIEADNR